MPFPCVACSFITAGVSCIGGFCAGCIGFSCIAFWAGSFVADYKSVAYVVTDKRICREIDSKADARKPPCFKMSGVGSAEVELALVNSIGMDPQAEQICRCLPTKQVSLGLPLGHPLANSGGGKRSPPYRAIIYCEVRHVSQTLDMTINLFIVHDAQNSESFDRPASCFAACLRAWQHPESVMRLIRDAKVPDLTRFEWGLW